MPRSPIRDKSIDVITDDGSILLSVADGEQIHINITLGWLTDLTGYTLTAVAAEALNITGDLVEAPLFEADTPQIVTLDIIDANVADNTFKVVIPKNLTDLWDTAPTPNDPAYAYFALKVADTGVGNAQQIFVPVRGLIEVRYNPVESVV